MGSVEGGSESVGEVSSSVPTSMGEVITLLSYSSSASESWYTILEKAKSRPQVMATVDWQASNVPHSGCWWWLWIASEPHRLRVECKGAMAVTVNNRYRGRQRRGCKRIQEPRESGREGVYCGRLVCEDVGKCGRAVRLQEEAGRILASTLILNFDSVGKFH